VDSGYMVSKRGPKGEAVEIRCATHEECTWGMKATGPRRDDDPIFLAQFRNHLEERKVPDVQALGHLRRARR
jgi:hypothetical protein